MKKYLLYLVLISFIGLLLVPVRTIRPVSAKSRSAQFASGRVLVKYKSEVEEPQIERDIEERIRPSSRAVESLRADAIGRFYLVKLQEGVSVEDAVSMLRQSPNVEYVEP